MDRAWDFPVFDGHNDALLRLWQAGPANAVKNFAASETGHLDLVKARNGGFRGGFFALFAPPRGKFKMPAFQPPYDEPLPDDLAQEAALATMVGQAGILHTLDRTGSLVLCRSGAEARAAFEADRIAAIMHLEGAEAIGPDLAELDLLYGAGLRSLGPVWSRPTIFGHGVPFRFPSDGDIGPGLTDRGKALVARCADLGVIVDTSHLNMAGFWDVAQAGVPLVATHSNAHAISPSARNLTDDQLRAIGENGGMVGLNFGMFLREDGRAAPEGGIDAAIRHLGHMIELAGEDCVGLGSDFDGAPMPQGIETAAGLPNLTRAMEQAQFGSKLVQKITSQNWLNFVERVL
jgi:membrane dipeptidase